MGDLSIKNKIIALSVLLFVLISLSCVNASQINETEPIAHFSENATDDVLNSDIGDFSTLNDEINLASQTKTLNLTKDYTYNPKNDKNYSNGININIDGLVIDGQGHTINANNQAAIFNIKSNDVILKNLVIINANRNSNGGAIYWDGLNGKITDSLFNNCTSAKSGGAIYFKNSVTISNSKFTENRAVFGGAVDFEDKNIAENCEFENNYATYLGGAVYSSGHSNFLNSAFTQNEAGDGGGIYFFSTGLVENTLFEKNIAIGYGGAITNVAKVDIRNSKFIENTGAYAGAVYLKDDGDIDNSTFSKNSAKTGGAIGSYCHNTYISNCEFDSNYAEKGKSLEIINKNVKIENASFTNNHSYYESEIYMECTNPILINLSYKNVTKKTETANNAPAKTSVKKVTKKKTAITAKSKTFKSKAKTKKYTITLKSGKTHLKNKKIKLRFRGKTYSAKTNKKGQAVFKLKINKKGKFKAIIRFYGDKLYKSSQKTVYIKIKK